MTEIHDALSNKQVGNLLPYTKDRQVIDKNSGSISILIPWNFYENIPIVVLVSQCWLANEYSSIFSLESWASLPSLSTSTFFASQFLSGINWKVES